ncbi:MAG TPA: ABC transporter permease [Longimicrobiales bacterium]|nr:ABC transporter permease [Longimicrobiales bacterium]
MHKVAALLRASALNAASYRLSLVLSAVGLLATIVPIYFVANALQPVMAPRIQSEAANYFGFVLVGIFLFAFIRPATRQFPNIISGGIATGTLEAMLSTSTRVPTIFAGLASYGFTLQLVRGVLMLGFGAILGAQLLWGAALSSVLIVLLTIVPYMAIGVLSATMVLVFRTPGPLGNIVMVLSGLLGGVYYPTHVIPGWLEGVSAFIPLTYGLRALRRMLLNAEPFQAVLPDVAILALFAAGLMGASAILFRLAFQHARRAGTLTHY